MSTPFDSYLTSPTEYNANRDPFFSHKVVFFEDGYELFADKDGERIALLSLYDAVNMKGKINGTGSALQGLIGERILAMSLDTLINRIFQDNPDEKMLGSVLREDERHRGKGFIVIYNERYLLRYKGETQLALLEKILDQRDVQWYGIGQRVRASEIDGMAYLHYNGTKYLIVGEAKTSNSWLNINDTDFPEQLNRKIFTPLQSLYPEHTLIYYYLAPERSMFFNGKLKNGARRSVETLENQGKSIIVMPLPELPRQIRQYGKDIQSTMPLIRKIVANDG